MVNVQVGILDNDLVGFYILPPRLTAAVYLLIAFVKSVRLDDIPVATLRDVWYLQGWFDQHFSRQWIGRNGVVLWPPRSPGLDPCDFFSWEHLKQLVYETPVNIVQELINRIENAVAEIRRNRHMIARLQPSLIRHVEACLASGGGQSE